MYKNCFSKTNISLLSKYNKDNYIIDLQSNLKSSFEFLYTLFKKKLTIFQDYLLENQISKHIQKFINCANVSILFVFKINKTFQLYVNYRKLNFVIIKNKYLLFLIKKTLNRLINVYYFIKFIFKNIYYRIRIRKSDK